ncbi:hypothetical protein [Mesorhizobium sp. M0207]|uniref:hypothetical protein n=1 Tax=Mesorhizobium sp. M0207 TaxID=2956915 RepID=UPI0033389895
MTDYVLWTVNGPEPVVLVTLSRDADGLSASVDQIGIVNPNGEQPWMLIGEPFEMLEWARDLASERNCALRVRLLQKVSWNPAWGTLSPPP